MRALTRLLLVSAAVTVGVTARPRVAGAQWAVADAGNLVQNTVTAAKTAQMVLQVAQQIQIMQQQLQYQLQTLKSIDPTSFNGIMQLFNQGQFTFQMLQGDISSMGYSLGAVNHNFSTLFPKNPSQWRQVRYADFDGYYSNWNTEITSSSLAAARAQSGLDAVDKNNRAIVQILSQSNNSSSGEVRQLQLINQQLALIHGEIASVVQNLATMGRVVSNWAAASAGEKLLTREAAQRRLDNYTSRGAPSRRLQHLP